MPGKAYSVVESTNLPAPFWTAVPFAATPAGALQTDAFSGSGDWMSVFAARSNPFGALRLQVKP